MFTPDLRFRAWQYGVWALDIGRLYPAYYSARDAALLFEINDRQTYPRMITEILCGQV